MSVTRIAMVVFPGFQLLDLSALTVFELANCVSDRSSYELTLTSYRAGPVASSSGIEVNVSGLDEDPYDTVMVVGANVPGKSDPLLVDAMRTAARKSRRVAGICTGTFVLAEAGLADTHRVTTHWAYAKELQERYPLLQVRGDKVFVKDRGIWSSAGMTACLDLALALVEDDLGEEVAAEVARRLVLYHRRPGHHQQVSALLTLRPASDRLHMALAYVREHLEERLTVDQLAVVAHWSARHLTRAFVQETGYTPAKAIEMLRLEAARLLIEGGGMSIARVAKRVGFGNEERMRRAFLRKFGLPPQAFGLSRSSSFKMSALDID